MGKTINIKCINDMVYGLTINKIYTVDEEEYNSSFEFIDICSDFGHGIFQKYRFIKEGEDVSDEKLDLYNEESSFIPRQGLRPIIILADNYRDCVKGYFHSFISEGKNVYAIVELYSGNIKKIDFKKIKFLDR